MTAVQSRRLHGEDRLWQDLDERSFHSRDGSHTRYKDTDRQANKNSVFGTKGVLEYITT
jgi:hypothetical protein